MNQPEIFEGFKWWHMIVIGACIGWKPQTATALFLFILMAAYLKVNGLN